MKIIKMGTLPENRTATATCNNCKTQIECTKGECKSDYYDQRDGIQGYHVICPLCLKNIGVYFGRN